MAKLVIVLLCVLTGVAALPRGASAKADAFPFVIPWDDAARTAIDVSALNPAPLDQSRRITIRGDHFYGGTGCRVNPMYTDAASGSRPRILSGVLSI